MENTILIIEDQAGLRQYTRKILEKNDYRVLEAPDGKMALKMMGMNEIDLILLDLDLGDMDGREIIHILRKQDFDIPIMVVSNFTQIDTKVDSFDMGCDDYLTKPFYKEELLARIRRLQRRVLHAGQTRRKKARENFQTGPFLVDYTRCVISKDGEELELGGKLFDLLAFFLENRGQVVKKDQLLDRFWFNQAHPSENTLMVHIHMIRGAIEENSSRPVFLKTKRGLGYILELD